MGLEVQDKINIKVARPDDLVIAFLMTAALKNFGDYIQTETQALSLELNGAITEGTILVMDEFELTVKIKKA